jgi:hypothetical protein
MNEQQYKIWWQLHRRVTVGEQLFEEEQRAYQSGLAELEAEEMAALGPAFRPSAVGGADDLENLV